MTARLAVNPRHQVTDVDPETGIGTCSKCGQVKAYRKGVYKGVQKWSCSAMALSYANERWKDPDVQRAYQNARFRRHYGITVEEYDALFEQQGGLCARCKQEPQAALRLAVDHCHSTGRVRGLLCGPCNTYLGRLEANMHMLIDDMNYLSAQPISERL